MLNASGTRYIHHPAGLGETRVTVPQGVRIIQDDAFRGCTALEEVSLPNTLERIEIGAFQNTGLKHITLPESIRYVSSYAFDQCQRLEQADIRCDSSWIEAHAFSECPRLRLSYDSPPNI